MTTDFDNCVFSVFCTGDLSLVLNAVQTIYKEKFNKDKAVLKMNEARLEKYLNPTCSGSVLPEFCCWKSADYPDKVFLFLTI